MLPDTGNSGSLVTVTVEYVYLITAVIGLIMYLDIMTTIMILDYFITWGYLATCPLCIFALVLKFFLLLVCVTLENLIFRCERSIFFTVGKED